MKELKLGLDIEGCEGILKESKKSRPWLWRENGDQSRGDRKTGAVFPKALVRVTRGGFY